MRRNVLFLAAFSVLLFVHESAATVSRISNSNIHFINVRVPVETLTQYLNPLLVPDTFNDSAWVSHLVGTVDTVAMDNKIYIIL